LAKYSIEKLRVKKARCDQTVLSVNGVASPLMSALSALHRLNLRAENGAENGDGGGVGGVHAEVGEVLRAQVLAFAEGGVGGVVEDADGERGLVQVDQFVVGVSFRPSHFVDAAQIRSRFHLHVSVPLLVKDGHVAFVLQKGAGDGDRFLVVHDGAVNEVGGGATSSAVKQLSNR